MFFRDFVVSVTPLSPTRAQVAVNRALGPPIVAEIEQPEAFKTLAASIDRWRKEDFEENQEVLKRTTAHLLYTTFFHGDIAREFKRRRANKGGLRIKIQAAEGTDDSVLGHWFFQTPWELMIDPEETTPLSMTHDLSFVRHCGENRAHAPHFPLPIADGLRILVLTANTPHGGKTINEQTFNQPIMEQAVRHAHVTVKVLEDASLFKLKQAMAAFRPHILHITGHGDKPRQRNKNAQTRAYSDLGLLFVTKSHPDGAHLVGAAELLAILKPHLDHLRLVTLASCYLGRAGRDPEGSFAASLCVGGVPAVAAFQFVVGYEAAKIWIDRFYGRLAHGDRLDSAMTHARAELYSELTAGELRDVESGSPVLFSRLPDGRLLREKQHVKVVSRAIELNDPRDEDVDVIDLTEFFVGAGLKDPLLVDGADWNDTLYPQLSFLTRTLTGAMPIRFEGPAHLSMFFALGYIFNETRNFEVGVVQVNRAVAKQKERGETWWSSADPEETHFLYEEFEGHNTQGDLVVCISTANLTKPGAERFFSNQGQGYRALLHWQPQAGFAVNSLPNQGAALFAARAMGVKIKQVAQALDVPRIHLFFSGPSGLALFLGMQLNGCPPIQLYEYKRSQSAYGPSFLLPPPQTKKDEV